MGFFVSKLPYSYQGCGAVTDAANVLELQYDDPTTNGPTKCQDTCIASSRAASLLLDGKCYCSKDGITSIEFAADPPPDEQLCTISCSEPLNFPHINLFNYLLHFVIIPGFSFHDIICNLFFHVFILRYNFIGVPFNPLFYNIVTLRFFFVDVNFHSIFYLIVVLEFSFFDIINLLLYVIVLLRLSFLDIVFKLLHTIILYNF
ncbi:hypothetical protein HER10_EVM0010309 [Colletotrichum scovillei]|uniref:uncharacterized protein n=1 Tax=Colletotrichum scovillei TaxID=1209932 RepID=UPI0015C2FB17|nr:uncharacterized protein HER10_EVM0010309 [Colletotrichum scovillei]KAF4775418.1 hypothetical protein HER10_EVM0010309 [Colletotrichum scovillei]